MLLILVGSLLLVVAAICALILLVNAFKQGVGQGLLSMFVPFYMVYFAVTRYTSPKKGAVIGIWITSLVVGVIMTSIGVRQMADATMEALHELGTQPLPSAQPALVGEPNAPSAPTPSAAPAAERIVHCDLRQTPTHSCIEDHLADGQTDALARTGCASSQLGAAHPVEVADGPCPTEGRGATCDSLGTFTYYYGPQDPSFFDNMRYVCSGTYTRN